MGSRQGGAALTIQNELWIGNHNALGWRKITPFLNASMPQSHGHITEVRTAILKQLHGNTKQIKMVWKREVLK